VSVTANSEKEKVQAGSQTGNDKRTFKINVILMSQIQNIIPLVRLDRLQGLAFRVLEVDGYPVKMFLAPSAASISRY
jgi:hypothetical protein